MLMKTTKWKSRMKMIKFNNKLLFSLKDNSQKLALKKTRVKEILKILKISWVLRRTKDADGRNHKCSFCAKTYLSYPALYTHLKNKHAKGPDGNPIAALNVGRGRGRPKKILGIGGL